MSSPFKNALHGFKHPDINMDSVLLAGIRDDIHALQYGLADGKGPKPKPVDITGKIEEANRVDLGEGVSIEEMRERLGLD